MPGGLLQLTTYQQDGGDMTNNTPQITFFKSVYKRFTNFVIENIEVDFNQYSEPSWDNPFELTSRLDNIGHLLSKVYLKVLVPQFNQDIDPALDVRWNDDCGMHIVDKVQFIIGGEIIQEFSNDWINIYYKRYMIYESYLQSKALLNIKNSPYKKKIINMQTFMYVFLPLYFSKEWSLSIPFLNIEYQSMYIKIIMKPIKQWLTVIENQPGNPFFGKRVAPYGTYIDTLKKMAQGKFIFSLQIHCGFLDKDEFKKLRSSTISYLIDQTTEIIQQDITEGMVSISIYQRLPIKEIWILPYRNDTASRNTWCNYSTLDRYDNRDGDLQKPISFLMSQYTPQDFLQQYQLAYVQNDIIPKHNIIETVSLILDEQYRFKNLSAEYLAFVQPFIHKYHYNTPDYIYNYSFAINPLQYQPSGFLNIERITTARLDIQISNPPPPRPTALVVQRSYDAEGSKSTSSTTNTNKIKTLYQPQPGEFTPYYNYDYAYKYNIKIIFVNFNILQIKAGMADLIIRK